MKKTTLWLGSGVAAILLVSFTASGAGGRHSAGRPPMQQGGARQVVTGSAVKTFSGSEQSGNLPELSVQSAKNDESALRVQNGASVAVNQLAVTKKGNASSEESSNFFSLNAAVAVWNKSALTVHGGRVATNGNGANAFVAYGANAAIQVANLEIYTTQDSSRGLHATYGGRIEGANLKITTQGAHCAALATDRGSGTVIVRNVQAKTGGDGSPGIYSTGNISATASFFEAFDAEAAVIEGKNTITVQDCNMIGHRRCGAMLYQSFSGDAETGTSVFSMNGGSLTAKVGPVFYVTNTNAQIKLTNAKLVSGNGVLVEAGSNRWGRTGQNGGHLKFYAESQALTGDVVVNDISDVTLSLGRQTRLNGAINTKATAGKVNLELADGAVWNVTADSSVDGLAFAGSTVKELASHIISNGHIIHYRNKQGLLNGGKIALDNGGMLIYTPAPKAAIQTNASENQYRNGNPPPPPPGGFPGGW